MSLKFVPDDPVDNNPALVQVMAWRRTGDNPLHYLYQCLHSSLTHICGTRGGSVKACFHSDMCLTAQLKNFHHQCKYWRMRLLVPVLFDLRLVLLPSWLECSFTADIIEEAELKTQKYNMEYYKNHLACIGTSWIVHLPYNYLDRKSVKLMSIICAICANKKPLISNTIAGLWFSAKTAVTPLLTR